MPAAVSIAPAYEGCRTQRYGPNSTTGWPARVVTSRVVATEAEAHGARHHRKPFLLFRMYMGRGHMSARWKEEIEGKQEAACLGAGLPNDDALAADRVLDHATMRSRGRGFHYVLDSVAARARAVSGRTAAITNTASMLEWYARSPIRPRRRVLVNRGMGPPGRWAPNTVRPRRMPGAVQNGPDDRPR
jgi:hypothetical protein